MIVYLMEVCPDCQGRRAHVKALYIDSYYGRSWVKRCESCSGHGEILRIIRFRAGVA
jgi:hypothetical protein